MLLSCLRARREPSIRCIECYQKNKALLQKSPRKTRLFCKIDLRNMCVCVYVCMCVWKALLQALKQELQSQCCCIAHCELSILCRRSLLQKSLIFWGLFGKRDLIFESSWWTLNVAMLLHCSLRSVTLLSRRSPLKTRLVYAGLFCERDLIF